MNDCIALLASTALFEGIPPNEIKAMMDCFRPARRHYQKNEVILLAGYTTKDIGVFLSGSAKGVKTTPGGASVSITMLETKSVFGDMLAGSTTSSPVTITALTPCEILFIPCKKLLTPCPALHAGHARLMQNLVKIISKKYFAISRRLDLLILKSLRAKLCCYLLGEAETCGADTFSVPYTRTGLAEYLNCERSALSREISRMQAEGLIEVYRNSFKLLNKSAMLRQYET